MSQIATSREAFPMMLCKTCRKYRPGIKCRDVDNIVACWRPVDDDPLQTQVGGEHYKNYSIQPAEFIIKNRLSYVQGNVIKYICRYEDKNGREDLEKLRHYIDMVIELEYGG